MRKEIYVNLLIKGKPDTEADFELHWKKEDRFKKHYY